MEYNVKSQRIKGESVQSKKFYWNKNFYDAEASSGFAAADSSKQGFSFKIKYIKNFDI